MNNVASLLLSVLHRLHVAVVEFIQLCGRKTKRHNRQYNRKYKITYNTKASTTNWMVIGDGNLMKFGNVQERKK